MMKRIQEVGTAAMMILVLLWLLSIWVVAVRAETVRPVCLVLVEERLSTPLQSELTQYATDLGADGWDVQIATFPNTASTGQVRDHIKAVWLPDKRLKHIQIVGRLAIPLAWSGEASGHGWYGRAHADQVYGMLSNPPIPRTIDGRIAYWLSLSRTTKAYNLKYTPFIPDVSVARLDFYKTWVLSGTDTNNEPLELAHYRKYFARIHLFRSGATVSVQKAIYTGGQNASGSSGAAYGHHIGADLGLPSAGAYTLPQMLSIMPTDLHKYGNVGPFLAESYAKSMDSLYARIYQSFQGYPYCKSKSTIRRLLANKGRLAIVWGPDRLSNFKTGIHIAESVRQAAFATGGSLEPYEVVMGDGTLRLNP